ncbi:hypothetical protein MRS44_002619 [Fusarium solani]|uniref:uncharacterized protein n=1 Tax=Fusarium solani TaxID=169388 RepID=UPI0032C42C36|nr:hypothetical protein MRS44_002619 [Fusarium solani]
MNCFTLLTGRIIFCFDFEALLGAYQGTHMVQLVTKYPCSIRLSPFAAGRFPLPALSHGNRSATAYLTAAAPASAPRAGASRDHGLGSAQASPMKSPTSPVQPHSSSIQPHLGPPASPSFILHAGTCPGFSASSALVPPSRSHSPGLTRPPAAHRDPQEPSCQSLPSVSPFQHLGGRLGS